MVKKIFGFNAVREKFCDNCPDTSMMMNEPEYFMDISVELQNRPSLQWALSDFFAQKPIESLFCDNCDKYGPGKMQYHIKAPPAVLVFHLKRFYRDSKGVLKKVTDIIPLSLSLDMSPFVQNSNSGSITYELRSTINHVGDEALKGHYTAFIQAANLSFFCFNDSSVTRIATEDVLESKVPFIIFYEMVSSSWSAQKSGQSF